MTEAEKLHAIYLAFPRHVAPRAAVKAIQKAAERLVKAKEQPDQESAKRYLWKRAATYARSPAGQKPPKGGEDFRPHPSTWFNQERYDDDPAEWQIPNGASNGRQQIGTRADRVVDSTRAAIERIENRRGARSVGAEEERGVQHQATGNLRGRVIDGTA